MTYVIEGIDPAPYAPLYGANEAILADRAVVRMHADKEGVFPCRVTLQDAPVGEALLLLNHESRGQGTPYHARHAIFVREAATAPARFVDTIPLVIAKRKVSLRAFDERGMMIDAMLAEPGEADAGLRSLFANPSVLEVDVHNAVRGCFSARARRHS